jgi:hypothetical protein
MIFGASNRAMEIGAKMMDQTNVSHAGAQEKMSRDGRGRPAVGRPAGGEGSAKNRASMPTDPKLRKMLPIGTGVLDYFPDALAAVAFVSYIGNKQHNPGKPLHWDRSKSTDEDDTVVRHFLERGTFDTDGTRHRAKLVWRALAGLQKEIEADGKGLFDATKVTVE